MGFRKFLGFPDIIPDRSTIWLFRERLAKTGKDELIWEELQRQLEKKGLKIREGVIQDATFIHSDPGHASVDTPRGEEANILVGSGGLLSGARCRRSCISKDVCRVRRGGGSTMSLGSRLTQDGSCGAKSEQFYLSAGGST